MTLEAGARSQLITFQRFTATTNDYGEEIQTWADLETAWAQVRFGTGQERRAAAQEGNEQAATFGVIGNPVTRALTVRDRINYLGEAWDIQALNPTSNNQGVVITATRSK